MGSSEFLYRNISGTPLRQPRGWLDRPDLRWRRVYRRVPICDPSQCGGCWCDGQEPCLSGGETATSAVNKNIFSSTNGLTWTPTWPRCTLLTLRSSATVVAPRICLTHRGQETGSSYRFRMTRNHMILSMSLILEGWRESHWQPRDSSPEQGGGRGWSHMVQPFLLYRNGGSFHPVWLHSGSGLSTDPAAPGSFQLDPQLLNLSVTLNIWQLLFDDGYDGIVNGFVWQHFVMIDGLDSGRWEHPDRLAIMGIVDRFSFQNGWWMHDKTDCTDPHNACGTLLTPREWPPCTTISGTTPSSSCAPSSTRKLSGDTEIWWLQSWKSRKFEKLTFASVKLLFLYI